ncbi:hypothetical protein ABMA28_015916 [Loxostege sticticalis]|uniref:Cytochrome P450 n=1 Tax=Loxostege sticticalis TaxID=481309 RepID=A0ABD0TBG5_LOXSC
MLWQIFLVCLTVWMLVLWWQNRSKRRLCKTIKSDITNYPLIGMTYKFVGTNEDRMKTLMDIGREAIKYNGWSSMWLGNHLFAVVADPIEAEFVLKTYMEKDDVLKMTQQLIGNGSIFASVPIWKPRRKVLAPTFALRNLNQFVNVFQQESAVMLDQLGTVAGKGPFSIWKFMTSYTMDSVCQTTLGSHVGVQTQRDHPFLQNFEKYAQILGARILQPWLHSNFIFKCTNYYTRSVEHVGVITDFVSKIITSKRAALKQNNNEQSANEMRSFLELLIESSGGDKGYTDVELLEESLVMLVAGTDTSAVGASFTAVMLSQHTDVQDKVYKELQEVFGDSDRPITAEDLPRLKYLEAVVKETLRLYPPVPITARKTDVERVTPAGIKLVSDVGVIIHMWAIHRNPRYWGADVEDFRPERFFDSPPTHPAAYMPFSYGPRNCLGYQYAMMSMKTVMASILRKYQILPSPETKDKNQPLRVQFDVMMKHVNNYKIQLVSRSH